MTGANLLRVQSQHPVKSTDRAMTNLTSECTLYDVQRKTGGDVAT